MPPEQALSEDAGQDVRPGLPWASEGADASQPVTHVQMQFEPNRP